MTRLPPPAKSFAAIPKKDAFRNTEAYGPGIKIEDFRLGRFCTGRKKFLFKGIYGFRSGNAAAESHSSRLFRCSRART